MHARTTTTAPAGPQDSRLQPPAYGVPSPALLARADRGFARFAAQAAPQPAGDRDDGGDGGGGQDTRR